MSLPPPTTVIFPSAAVVVEPAREGEPTSAPVKAGVAALAERLVNPAASSSSLQFFAWDFLREVFRIRLCLSVVNSTVRAHQSCNRLVELVGHYGYSAGAREKDQAKALTKSHLRMRLSKPKNGYCIGPLRPPPPVSSSPGSTRSPAGCNAPALMARANGSLGT